MTRSSSFVNVADVVDWRLCLGCGACAPACPQRKISIIDITALGLRPAIDDPRSCAAGCRACLDACPGIEMSHADTGAGDAAIAELRDSWGPVLEVWEGHASDPAIHFDGSSAGAATALALHCIGALGARGAVHIAADETLPHLNRAVVSRTREALLAATGSRYAPAAPCTALDQLGAADLPVVFVGKPCDIQGLRKLQRMHGHLRDGVVAAIGIFCAGTPSTQGTLDLLASHGLRPQDVDEVRYRGRGWPGTFAIRLTGSTEWRSLATYAEAWGFLQAYRPSRCHLCPDGTSEFADISCGDPWYREVRPGEVGSSLVVVRTPKGRGIVQNACESGALVLRRVDPSVLALSQRELGQKRGAVWGRGLALRALGVPAPQLRGFALGRNWLRLPLPQKLRSVLGTARRAIQRGSLRRQSPLPPAASRTRTASR